MFIIFKKKNIIKCCIAIFLLIFTISISSFGYNYYRFVYNETVLTQNITERINQLYKNDEKIAYLTFDDGPTQKVTPKVLNILDKMDVKANFFLLGVHVEKYPDIVKREYEEGHFLANHGYSHNNALLYKSKDAFLNEIRSTDAAIGKAIGLPNYKCHLFRFPNGSVSNIYHKQKMQAISFLSEIDYTYIDWNVVNNDSIRKYSQNQLLNNLKKSCKGKNTIVILMHDTGDVNNTYDVLEDSIAFLKQEGYVFKTFHDFFKS